MFNQGGEWVRLERDRTRATMADLTALARQSIIDRKLPVLEPLEYDSIIGGTALSDYENV